MRVQSFSKDLEGAELGDAEDVLLEDVEGDDLGGEVVKGLQAPPAAFAQLLAVGPDFEGNKLKKELNCVFNKIEVCRFQMYESQSHLN